MIAPHTKHAPISLVRNSVHFYNSVCRASLAQGARGQSGIRSERRQGVPILCLYESYQTTHSSAVSVCFAKPFLLTTEVPHQFVSPPQCPEVQRCQQLLVCQPFYHWYGPTVASHLSCHRNPTWAEECVCAIYMNTAIVTLSTARFLSRVSMHRSHYLR